MALDAVIRHATEQRDRLAVKLQCAAQRTRVASQRQASLEAAARSAAKRMSVQRIAPAGWWLQSDRTAQEARRHLAAQENTCQTLAAIEAELRENLLEAEQRLAAYCQLNANRQRKRQRAEETLARRQAEDVMLRGLRTA